jgi:hypothetical protein
MLVTYNTQISPQKYKIPPRGHFLRAVNVDAVRRQEAFAYLYAG